MGLGLSAVARVLGAIACLIFTAFDANELKSPAGRALARVLLK
jgi:hypothetical protein